MSHCDGGRQIQQASQSNTTVQAVGPPVPSDGGSGLVPNRTESHRTSSTPRRTSTPPTSSAGAPAPGVTQVQVGCVEHCYGSTTRDHSGLTLAQIDQLLGQLQAPTPPAATAAPGDAQNVTQQSAAQSQSGGSESQTAGQANGTVQAVVGAGGAPGAGSAAPAAVTGGAAPAAVNHTAQGVVQLQVGCIFYCSGTRQTQQAQQSTTTVQSVNSGGAGAANTVSRVVWQVQVGCVVWCYNAVESQSAGASDSTVVAVAPPPGAAALAEPGEGPQAPVPGQAPSAGAHRGDSGGAPVRVHGAQLGAVRSSTAGGGRRESSESLEVSVLAQAGGGTSLVSVATSRTVQTRVVPSTHRGGRQRSAPVSAHAAEPVMAAGPSAVPASSTAQPALELAVALALALAALGSTVLRRRGVR